jgi:predicted MFS family arabinose efflux permease
MFATFLFLTYYFQLTLHYSAIRSGFAFLPFSVGIIVGASVSSRLLPRVGPRALMVAGFLLAAGGLLILTRVSPVGGYLVHVLPAELITSVGMGLSFVPLSSTALIGVDEADAGVASALVNTTQQTGGSLGVALLNTVAASASASWLAGHRLLPGAFGTATVHGYTTAFTVSAVLLFAAMATSLLIRGARHDDEKLVPELEAVAA